MDFLGTLSGPLPRTVPAGCYISWIDPQDGNWHQQRPDGTFVTASATPGSNPRDDRDKVSGGDDPDLHNVRKYL